MKLLLDDKISLLARALTDAEIPHAFGGALALTYYATPRATQDIDLNVFVPAKSAARVLAPLASLGVATRDAGARREINERGQVRLYWERTPVDLFFAYDPLHHACLERLQHVVFSENQTIPILSAEDLAIFKVLFDRAKDWRDIADMLHALGREFDAAYALDWVDRILEGGDTRAIRFREIVEQGERA